MSSAKESDEGLREKRDSKCGSKAKSVKNEKYKFTRGVAFACQGSTFTRIIQEKGG